MAFGRMAYISLAALIAVVLFCTVSAEADESEAAPVAGFSSPLPVMAPLSEADPDESDESKHTKPSAEDVPLIPMMIQHMIPEDAFDAPPAGVPDVDDVDEPEEMPVPIVPPMKPPSDNFHRVIRLNFESMLELYVLQKTLSNINSGKDDNMEEVEEQDIVVIEETDSDPIEEPVLEIIPLLPEFIMHVPTPILNTAGDAVGPISVF